MSSRKDKLLRLVAEHEKTFRDIQQQEDDARERLKTALPTETTESFVNAVKELLYLSESRRDAWQKAANIWDEIEKCE